MYFNMNLQELPFRMIVAGIKTIELRLYDDKRQKLNVGDKIVFTNASSESENITVQVNKIHVFNNFLELFIALGTDQCGFKGLTPKEAASAMTAYYPVEVSSSQKVVGIEFEISSNE